MLRFGGFLLAEEGATAQSLHCDGEHLFEQQAIARASGGGQAAEKGMPCHLPPHCINVFVPLVDLESLDYGPTLLFPGTHLASAHSRSELLRRGREEGAASTLQYVENALDNAAQGSLEDSAAEPVTAELKAGQCLLFDYRLVHAGLPTKVKRPVLYLTYTTPWFDDTENFSTRSLYT